METCMILAVLSTNKYFSHRHQKIVKSFTTSFPWASVHRGTCPYGQHDFQCNSCVISSLGGPNRLSCSKAMLFFTTWKKSLGFLYLPPCSADSKFGRKLIVVYYTVFMMSLYYLKPKLEHFECCSWPMHMSVWYHMTVCFPAACLVYLGKYTLKFYV